MDHRLRAWISLHVMTSCGVSFMKNLPVQHLCTSQCKQNSISLQKYNSRYTSQDEIAQLSVSTPELLDTARIQLRLKQTAGPDVRLVTDSIVLAPLV